MVAVHHHGSRTNGSPTVMRHGHSISSVPVATAESFSAWGSRPSKCLQKKYREIVKSIAPSTRRYPRSKSTRISDDSFHHQAVGFSGPSLTTIIHPFGIQATLTLQSSGLDGRPGVDHHSKQQQSSPMEEPHWNPLEYHHQQSNLSNHWIP